MGMPNWNRSNKFGLDDEAYYKRKHREEAKEKKTWKEEFKDKVQLKCGKIGKHGIYLSLEKGMIFELIKKYIGDNHKVKIQVREGELRITKI